MFPNRAAASRREVVGSGDPVRGPSRLYMERLREQASHRFSLARHRRRHGGNFKQRMYISLTLRNFVMPQRSDYQFRHI